MCAFDILWGQLFALRAYLILVLGDIPAVSMFMPMKGHNGISPSRMCKIIGLRVPGSSAATHCVPLDLSCHPDVENDLTAVEAAKTTAEVERWAKEYGVKGVPLFSFIKSLSFPHYFPFDFMHLIWENRIKNLILLWTGDFKGLDQGTDDYCTPSASGTIPSAYGSRVPRIGPMFLRRCGHSGPGPVLLRRRFRNRKYYTHFIELV
ncbi:hypothetical protein DFH07DRAFT_871996 [Mycena maculata]|uniref:Uncharacterized protein n=1 Tax=Mycena maculata TaxID=230809 RepID=A0AAD7MLL9_9AGAR|nr:hypothetical protein DFH07DRAFT_871996 [Mycena maculata]